MIPDRVEEAANNIAEWVTYLWVIGLSTWGGAVSYFYKIAKYRRKFDILKFLGEISTSGFVGVLTFLLCDASNFSWEVTAAMVGISGHMGTRAIFILEKKFERTIGNEKIDS